MTTDPQDELFDVLDARGGPTGVTKPRGLVHRDGDWHRALHIWVGGVGDEGPFVLFQRRSRGKDTWPGALDVAVGGHARTGETLAATVREAEEEIGLALGLDALTPLGRRFRAARPADPARDNELQHIFAVRSDAPLHAYRLHPEEVDALVACPLDAVARLLRDELTELTAREHPREGVRETSVVVRRSDFAPISGDYAARALAGLAAVLRGTPVEPFDLPAEAS